jgi:iron complex transport system substrate-binding protein
MRICSFLPSATEMLYALDLGPSVVGISHDCDYPPDVRTKPVVIGTRLASGLAAAEIDQAVASSIRQGESLYYVDQERLAALAPELVVTQALCDVCTIDDAQLARAIHALTPEPSVLTLTPHTLEDVLGDIERVGAATQTGDRAAHLVASLRARIARVRARATQWRPVVVCLEWLAPPFAAGHWVPELVELAGGVEPIAHRGANSARTTWDTVCAADPDIIIVMPCGYDTPGAVAEYQAAPLPAAWTTLRAVQENRVFAVDASAYFSRPGPRLVDGLELLSTLFHDPHPTAPPDRWSRLGKLTLAAVA